jgi:mannosyltransferase OCH1-like enzyme
MIYIPRTFHRVWLGQAAMHPQLVEWERGWAALHPGWQSKTWREVPGLPRHVLAAGDDLIECRHPDYLARCQTLAKKSDVWRYEILEQLGGVYLDCDFAPLKCIEPLLEDVRAFAGLCRTRYPHKPSYALEVGCSIMGTVPGHPWLQELVAKTPKQAPDAEHMLSLAFIFTTETVANHSDVALYDPVTFYPIPWDRCPVGQPPRLPDPSPDTYAIHSWGSRWIPEGLRILPTG